MDHICISVELCIGAGKTGTSTGRVRQWRRLQWITNRRVQGQQYATKTWFPSRVAQPPAGCRMLVHGVHFTLTPAHCHNKY